MLNSGYLHANPCTELDMKSGLQGNKTFFMLHSTEHEIFPAHKC